MTPVYKSTIAKGTNATRWQKADLCRSPAALQYRLPGRRERPGLAGVRPGRQVSRGLGGARPEDNPLPGVHGRVCYHPCERAATAETSTVCRHSRGRTLSGRSRGATRMAAAGRCAPLRQARAGGRGWPERALGAYHLTRLGHEVEIREAGPLPGGMLHFGIPAYRLPREDLMKEIRQIEAMGVRIVRQPQSRRCSRRTRKRVSSTPSSSRSARISPSIWTFPRATRSRCSMRCRICEMSRPGRRRCSAAASVIYGGGNTAMDAARTARRLGAEEAMIDLTVATGPTCRLMGSRRGSAGRGHQDQVADVDQGDRRTVISWSR